MPFLWKVNQKSARFLLNLTHIHQPRFPTISSVDITQLYL
jgi:hypothetical protein